MLLRRFYDDKLAQASYMVGCQATGEALVVDPNRDIAHYLSAAADEDLRVTHVTETHIHADFLSGARELAALTGAELLLSGEAPPDWAYRFAEEDGARLLRHGDEIEVGRIRIRVLHTPGHTPEHLSFTITDGAATDEPMGVLTGDFVFVGDVGRPDLLEKAAGEAGTMEAGARDLYRSLERFRRLPPYLQILPGHGAGSACGKALGAVPTSTLGYEMIANWAFQTTSREQFVEEVLADQPEPPAYFATMKRMNRDGPPPLGGLPDPPRVAPEGMRARLADGTQVVDVRPRDAFATAHVPGTLNIPLNRSFPNWAGWLLAYGEPIHLVARSAEEAREAARDLALIGLDDVVGWSEGDEAVASVDGEGYPVLRWDEAERVVDEEGGLFLDVRRTTEWNEGHVPGAEHVHLGYLRDRADELPRDRPLLIYCRTGARSAIGASLLQARGFPDVRNVDGGIVERRRLEMEVTGR